jgi:predicted RNA binding protein YcfA (HicA-like mRNA interferase family)
MPRLGPIKRKDLILYLRGLGFEGPYSGAKHQFMVKASIRLRIPNPHHQDITAGLLARLLREAGVARDDWDRL